MTITFMLAITSKMSRSHLPFVICKLCLAAFDVDLGDKIKTTRATFGIGHKRHLDANIDSTFEARCAYCKKLSEYSKGDTLWNTDLSNGDSKLSEMMYAENIALRRKVRVIETELKTATRGKMKAEKERDRVSDNLDRISRGGEPKETIYKKHRSNPLSG